MRQSSATEFKILQCSSEDVAPLRTRYRAEVNSQIVHDSIHRRNEWTLTWRFQHAGHDVGFASIAIKGPWTKKPTVFEMFLLPEYRGRAFELFEAFVESSGAQFFEVQTNCGLLGIMPHVYGREITSEKVVFHDALTTSLPSNGSVLRQVTSPEEIQHFMAHQQGCAEWLLEFGGTQIGKGGICFHYNRPYGDIYMEIEESHRRRGFGAFLVQELKRACYGLGALSGARCNPGNAASRRTLQKAGFVPCAHILTGPLASHLSPG